MYIHTSYILLHFTQRHGSCLSSSVINYVTQIASDHNKWYKWSSQKQLIIRSENVSKLPRWWWKHRASLPQARNREVEKPIRHPDMCIDRLIHAMKQLHFSLILLQNFQANRPKNKSSHCRFMRSFDWSMALWLLVVSLARFFNIDDSRVLQVPSCPQDGGLVQGWESLCSIGFQDIIIDFLKRHVQSIADSRKCFWEMRDICAMIVVDFENAKHIFVMH
jgi:hypothetical protein